MSGCREFMGARTKAGYGERRVDGKVTYVHRWVVEQIGEDQFGTPWDPELKVRHTCDNPACFLYDHLVLGTQGDNAADMMDRGRGRGQFESLDLTHCRHGHPYDEANTYIDPRGLKQCRTCRRAASARSVAKRKS